MNFSIVVNVHAASCADRALPSDHVAPAMVWNVHWRPSEDVLQPFAKSPTNSVFGPIPTRYGYTYWNVRKASLSNATNGLSESMPVVLPILSTPPSRGAVDVFCCGPPLHAAARSASARVVAAARIVRPIVPLRFRRTISTPER